LYVPSNYNPNKATPLLVLLHGLTSNPEQVIGYDGISQQAEKYGMIVVAPFGYNEGGWYGSMGPGNDFGSEMLNRYTKGAPSNLGELSEKDVLNVLEIIRNEFNIDDQRIYLSGHSMGGGGTLYLGMKHAGKWAALAAMAPAIYTDPAQIETIKSTPIIIVQGDKDNLVPVAGTRRWIGKMKELDMSYKYIEIADGDHVQSISRNEDMMAEVFSFLHKQKLLKRKSSK
jgi:predicted peptidase